MGDTRYTVRAIPIEGITTPVSGFLYEIGETRSRNNPDILAYYEDRQDARDAITNLVEADWANGLRNSYTHEVQG